MTTALISETNRRGVLLAMLTALRDETYERVHGLRREQVDDNELAPGDEMDRARASIDLETHASLIARAEERLRYIDEAAGRAEKGRYGICAGCSEPIPLARLRALPFAVYCVACQQKRRSSDVHGWSDGTTIQPYDQQWTLPAEMEDAEELSSAADAVQAITAGSAFAENAPMAEPPRVRRKRIGHKK
jgi:RNA polymerase-binding transcription factor DksA